MVLALSEVSRMMVSVPTASVTVKVTKVAVRCRYDIPTYESGGLTWCDVLATDTHKDGYLVEKDGKVIGLAYKWDDGKWTGERPASVKLPEGPGAHAFYSVLYSGKTRNEVISKLVYWASRPTY